MGNRVAEKWVIDAFLGVAGWNILHPGSQPLFELFGYNHYDVERVFSRAKSTEMLRKSWVTTALEIEAKAQAAEERGFRLAARDLYHRAGLLWGRAQYGYFADDPRKTAAHARLVNCFAKVSEFNPTPVERIAVPFEGKNVHTTLHLPAGPGPFPCVILLPGMDMFRDDWHAVAQRFFLERGFAALAVDGPGQGETLLHGLKVNVTNYERAVSACIDHLLQRPEIDGERLVLYGVSMGSYWGARVAATDHRIKAAATALGCYGSKYTIFNAAQPNFRINFQYMSGVYDEAEFDQMAGEMSLDSLVPQIRCPFLMAHGEFDELNPLEDVYPTYERVTAPKELWIFGDEFHPMGGVAHELVVNAADWLVDKLANGAEPGMDRRTYISRDGTYTPGGKPYWWLEAR